MILYNKEYIEIEMKVLNYIGSKYSLINTIIEVIKQNIPNISKLTILDLFAGTGTVSYHLSKHCKKTIANDLEYYSYVITTALICCNYSEKLEQIIEDCNKLSEKNGLIYSHFSPSETCERMFFTNNNARQADAIRQYIEKLYENKEIKKREYYFLLASLLVCLDKVANTASVYGAFLKKFKKSALKKLIIVPIHQRKHGQIKYNQVFNTRAEQFVTQCTYDVIYLDPPYNQRQYGANYSPLNYIAKYNSQLELKGKSGLLVNYNKSDFCSRNRVKETFEKLFANIQCKYIVLSYNNEGLLSEQDLEQILLQKGDITLYKLKYPRYNSRKGEHSFIYEYIWFITVVNKSNLRFYEEIEITQK